MVSLHQLRCFLATVESGSFTKAAAALGLAQPSLSEQIRALERAVGGSLFQRVGRGVVPTEAARALAPHAAQAVEAAERGRLAVASAGAATTGTIRFGLFGAAHLYLGAEFVRDVRDRFPRARLELVGQNSMDVIEEVRRGRLEAALVALPIDDHELEFHAVVRDEVLYVTADETRARRPVTPVDLAAATLVVSEVTWGDDDYTRRRLKQAVQSVGGAFEPAVEVENVETALEVAALGVADAVAARSVLRRVAGRSGARLHGVPFEPRVHDHFAIVHRRNAHISAPVRAVVELATARMRELAGE